MFPSYRNQSVDLQSRSVYIKTQGFISCLKKKDQRFVAWNSHFNPIPDKGVIKLVTKRFLCKIIPDVTLRSFRHYEVSVFGVILVRIFPHSVWITLNTDTFHAVWVWKVSPSENDQFNFVSYVLKSSFVKECSFSIMSNFLK